MPSHRAETQPLKRARKRPNASPSKASPRKATQRAQTASLSAPQVGIASALGLATIAVPLSGALAAPAPTMTGSHASASALAGAPAFPKLRSGVTSVEHLKVLPSLDPRLLSEVPGALKLPRVLLVTRATRSYERSVLPGCTGQYQPVAAANGQLPGSILCTLWDNNHTLRADAAVALAKLNIAYQQRFGTPIVLTDGYRTLAEQRVLKAIKPSLAATPGTSEHGWGLAVDMGGEVQTGKSARYLWLRANAPSYGWDNPDWALSGGSGPYEPWHWEYVDGE